MPFRLSKYLPFFWQSQRPPSIGPTDPSAPVVIFIAGLSSTALESWEGWFTLAASDPEMSSYRLDSFDYPTALFSLPKLVRMPMVSELARSLMSEIDAKYSKSQSITLVGHSMGGLIAKQALIDEAKAGRSIRKYQVMLCAVPHKGAEVANFAKILPWGQRHLVQLSQHSGLVASQLSEWKRLKIERRVRCKYLVGGADAVVAPESACHDISSDNVEYFVKLDHTSIIDPKENAYSSLKKMLAVPDVGQNPLFDIYSSEDDAFYLKRQDVDTAAEESLRHSNIWFYGVSGSGKTTLVRRTTHALGWQIVSVLMTAYENCSAEELIAAVKQEVVYLLGEATAETAKNSAPGHAQFKAALLPHALVMPLCIVVEEIPPRSDLDFQNFVLRLSQLTESIDNDDALKGKVRIAVTSIKPPQIANDPASAKIRERIQFVEVELWTEADLIALLDLIASPTNIMLSIDDMEFLAKESEGHPRFVKQVLRDLRSRPSGLKGLRSRIVFLKNELVQ